MVSVIQLLLYLYTAIHIRLWESSIGSPLHCHSNRKVSLKVAVLLSLPMSPRCKRLKRVCKTRLSPMSQSSLLPHPGWVDQSDSRWTYAEPTWFLLNPLRHCYPSSYTPCVRTDFGSARTPACMEKLASRSEANANPSGLEGLLGVRVECVQSSKQCSQHHIITILF